VRIIVPLPPGSPPDVLARLIADKLQDLWKQSVVVENRPGATGMIGMDALAKSAPDGYTMGIMFLTHAVLPALFGKVPYDMTKDFAPVSNLVWLYNALVVNLQVPVQSTKEFIDLAAAKPGQITYGSGGNGSPAHLLSETFVQSTKVNIVHVPFKGPAEAVQGLLGGHVDAMFATTSAAVPMIRSGKIKALAVTSPQRLKALPQVPTLAESGVSNFEMREWEGVVAPAGTPKAIITKWNTDLARIMAMPDVREKLADLGMETANPNSPEEFSSLISEQLAYWTQFVKSRGLKPG
jgi:tripartite-type tricarboxylate transporter receptor subunit TctC